MSTAEVTMPAYLIDEENHKHYITRELGKGAQGAVYRTKDDNVVIKVVMTEDDQLVVDEKEYDIYKSKIDDIRILQIPKGVNIAKPELMLKKPYNGYVMRLLNNMVPISELLLRPSVEDPFQHYLETGGLRRRLQILTKLARMFSHLQSLPIVYGDISENNIYISENPEETEVWLIDSDNMRYMMDFESIICTPGYGAPEVVKGISCNTTYSDVYSFAILAFKMLAFVDPFFGVRFEEDNSDDWDDDWSNEGTGDTTDPDELAGRGELPWIEDRFDDSNRSKAGFNRKHVLTQRMFDLFQQTFGLEGRQNPVSRPTMEAWYECLLQASEATVKCHECKHSYYFIEKACPYCHVEKRKHLETQIFNWFHVDKIFEDDEFITEKFDVQNHEQNHLFFKQTSFKTFDYMRGKHYLTNRHTEDAFFTQEIENTVELDLGNTTFIKNLSKTPILVTVNGTNKELNYLQSVEVSRIMDVIITIHLTQFKTRYIKFELRD
ncbi:protein kinase domain-containing protein [Ectobacillus funiculus]|uniref:protein kinase domain-containing protein n=1 Tax=Ectobacillus funiculus TaxID=137993 RepID=UPI00101C0BAA|nr:protein kinase [Ectobacillus funiculus]